MKKLKLSHIMRNSKVKKPVIKVDRVCDINKIKELEYLGVDIITVPFEDKRKIFKEDIVNNIEYLSEIKNALSNAKFGISNINSVKSELILNNVLPDYLQLESKYPDGRLIDIVKNNLNINIFFSEIDADYDMDPSWILGSYKNLGLNFVNYQLEVFGGLKDSWINLKHVSPKYSDELQIIDINNLASKNNIFISLDFNIDNIIDIINSFPEINGISFTLGELRIDNYWIHVIRYNSLVEILKKINKHYQK